MCPMTTRKRKVKPLEEVNEDPSKTPSRTRKRKAASIEAEDVAVDEKKIDPSSSNMTEEEEKLARLEKYGAPVRGKAVAGRDWKRRRTSASSAVFTAGTPTLATSWSEKSRVRADRKATKDAENALLARKRAELEKRREATKKKREQKKQNELKSMQFQVIRNTSKINRMSKKQRRLLVKMDTSQM